MRSPSVSLAVWLREHSLPKLYHWVTVYWVVRNAFLEWYDPKAFKVWKFFAPKCKRHPSMALVHGICGRCAIERTVQRVRLDRLAGRR